MISSSAGPGAVYLTDEEELTYEWYREIIYSGRRTGRVFRRDLSPFSLVAAVLIVHHPRNPPGSRYDVHIFGLRPGDRERSYIPAPVYIDHLMREEAAPLGAEIPPVTPRHSWPGEAATLDEIRDRFTAWIVNPALRRVIGAHNLPWRRDTPPEYAPVSRVHLRAVGEYRCGACGETWTDEDPGTDPHSCPSCGAKIYPHLVRWLDACRDRSEERPV